MITKGAHHVSLTVADLSRSREFYEGLLGLSQIERPELGLPGAWYQAGAVQLHLIELPAGAERQATRPKLSPLANHLAFEISSYAAVKRELETAGFEVVALGEESGQLFVQDPDGHVLEFNQPRSA